MGKENLKKSISHKKDGRIFKFFQKMLFPTLLLFNFFILSILINTVLTKNDYILMPYNLIPKLEATLAFLGLGVILFYLSFLISKISLKKSEQMFFTGGKALLLLPVFLGAELIYFNFSANQHLDRIPYMKYSQKQYTEAYQLALQRLSKKENAEDNNLIGHLYLWGHAVPQNSQEAIKWLKKAAAENDPSSMFDLGEIYYFGDGNIPRDYQRALSWFAMSKVAGIDSISDIYMGDIYFTGGYGIQQNREKAFNYYLAATHFPPAGVAYYKIGFYFLKKNNDPNHLKKSEEWLKKSYQSLLADPCLDVNLGDLYTQGKGISQDLTKAKKLYREAAELFKGSLNINIDQNNAQVEFERIKKDFGEASELFKRSLNTNIDQSDTNIDFEKIKKDFAEYEINFKKGAQANSNSEIINRLHHKALFCREFGWEEFDTLRILK